MVLSFSLRCLSIAANQNSFTVSYLINTCGLSPESALSASKHVQFETPDKPDLVISYFQNLGFSKAHISSIIRRYPRTLSSNPEKFIFPKVEFFRSKGASTPDLVRIFVSNPWILKRSLENHLIPTFNFFRDLLQTDQKTISTIKLSPGIMARRLESEMIPNINILRENGVSEANILLVLRYHAQKLGRDAKMFKKIVDEVNEMGFDPSKSQFVLAIIALRGISKSTWDEKVEAYKRWGWSDEDIGTAFGKYPWCMTISTDKIMAVMDFYVDKLGLDSSVIANRPVLLSLSLKKRLLPRASVIQYLSSKGLVKIDSRIARLFEMT
ncbi:hypothetical protein JCGZ_24554 [Jatropha curcas]|uniref:Uncharacterized protein n=1 Tax=Jatropha curcas TaxID=180498 RepID=A0A067L7S2_JATCU|nr:uncharacterized protein LOC105631252 [Jatropha curcas]KDP40555.1 hypothetical protein JCGZ_24554 [Jatropha curcas]